MRKVIEDATKVVAAKITPDMKGDDALKFTQAMLNLAHTAATWDNMSTPAAP